MWTRQAAEQGEPGAQYLLGRMYNSGRGVPRDHTAAVEWYRQAAEQGQADAQFFLGAAHLRGHGVPQDYVLAHLWFNLAASRLPPGKMHEQAVQGRDTVAAKMTHGQIAEAQRLAREWKPKSP